VTEDIPGIELLGVLGRGRRSVVHRGRRDGREYAVKIVATPGADDVAAFRREAAILGCLGRADVPKVRDVGTVGTSGFLVMELIDGRVLREVMSASRLTPYDVARVGAHLARTLAVAHRAGIVHRDLTPENIIVRQDGSACLVDFGLACRGGWTTEDLSTGGLVYSSPEQTGALHRPVDQRSDLYSLGVVMYEILAGRPPFAGEDRDALIRSHLADPVPALATRSPGLPLALDALVSRLLAKDPDDRYLDAESVADDLERIAAALHPYTSETASIPVRAKLKPLGSPEPPPDLVGRDAAWYRLTERLNRAGHGSGGVVLVTGPSGIGKTRLADVLADWAHRSGSVVLGARCLPGDGTPLAPVRTCVENYLQEISERSPREAAAARAWLESVAGEDAGLLRALSPALGRALGAPALVAGPGGEGEQRFHDAIVTFLTKLADLPAGGVVVLDDVHLCDPATLRLLQRLCPALASSRLMLVLTVRTEPGENPGRALATVLGTSLDTRIDLAPLSREDVADLLTVELGGLDVDEDIVSAVVERSGGNPLLIAEFLRCVLDAGLLTPTWDGWRMDGPAVEGLELPGNVTDLLVRQLQMIEPDGRKVLAVAAVIGPKFSAEAVADVCSGIHGDEALRQERISHALADALSHQLLVRSGPLLTFVHQRVRWALLAELDDDERRMMHRAVADHLTFGLSGPPDAETVYAVARHLSAAGPQADQGRTFAALLRAGTAAVGEYCPTEALEFLREAEALAPRIGVPLPVQLHASTGAAAVLLGDLALADERLGLAAALTADPAERVDLVCQQVHVRQLQWRGREAMQLVQSALADLGRPQPTGWALAVRSLGWALLSALAMLIPLRRRRVRGPSSRTRQLVARLSLDGASAAAVAGDNFATAAYFLRSLHASSLLGPSRQYCAALAGAARLAMRVGMPHLARRLVASAEAATPAHDPVSAALVAWYGAQALDVNQPLSDGFGERMADVVAEHGRWLDPCLCFVGLSARATALVMRGLVSEAEEVLERGRARTTETDGLGTSVVTPEIVHVAAVAGHATLAQTYLEDFERFLKTVPPTPTNRFRLAQASLQAAYERGDTGVLFDRAAADLDETGARPWLARMTARPTWLYLAWGRLEQLAQSANEGERRERLLQVRKALGLLRKAADGPMMGAFRRVTLASFDELTGHPARALRRLDRTMKDVVAQDVPLLEYEVARVRARAHRDLGRQAQARRHAEVACQLAQRNGWEFRERWIRSEFDLEGLVAFRRFGSGPQPSRGVVVGESRQETRRAAVSQAAVAVARSTDPESLVRTALADMLAIFSAERAFLLLPGDAQGDEAMTWGADREGHEPVRLTGHGSTLVARVRQSGEAVIVIGTEEGEAPGLRIVEPQSLRSILVAPVWLGGRQTGVAYLEGRAAEGVFTAEDLDTLAVLTSQVALSLETVRAVRQAAVARVDARRQELAEALRMSMARLSSSVEPSEVLAELVRTVQPFVPGSTVAVVDGDDAADDPVLDMLLSAQEEQPSVVTAAGAGPRVLGEVRQWMSVPLAVRARTHALLLIGGDLDTYGDVAVTMVAAAAQQAASALEIAVLNGHNDALSRRDPLTGLPHRKAFLEYGERVPAGDPSVAAVIVDIDRFRAVNDRYGRAVGDEVITEVAGRLSSVIRDGDVLCRYGGEEFAVLLANASPEQAENVACRLHDSVSERRVETSAGSLRISVSVGLAVPGNGDGFDGLLRRADSALVDAKRNGRDQVVIRSS
jgi:diguanylate cyclase (GGDEF)-like protein